MLTKKDVEHVAKLANLTLNAKEVKIFTNQLQEVLTYMEELEKVDTKGVYPTFQVLDGTQNIYRKDKVKKGLAQKEALSQSKETSGGYFVAEHVFGEKAKSKIIKETKERKQLDKNNAVLTKVDEKGTVGHKDLFMTKGVETTAGSEVLNGDKAQYSSAVVDLLEKAGYKTKYKLNQDAWGHGASGENSDFGPTTNPWNESLVPGGSSSGSAVAVSKGIVEIATGTDTGGSIRYPSGFCNVTSIKPTYGALSRYGVIAFASSLDCPSLISENVSKVRKYYELVSQGDNNDATSQSRKRSNFKSRVKTIGIPKEYYGDENDKEIEKALIKAISEFKKLGYKIKDVSLPHSKLGVSVYYIVAPTETSSNLARYDGVRYGKSREYFGDEARRRIMLGTYTSSTGYTKKYYEKAARVRSLIIKDFEKVFNNVDVLLTPTSPIPPFKIGEKSKNPLQLYLVDIYMSAVSLAGLPALALPCGFTNNNLPIGMQLIGPRWSEEGLFGLGEKYQKSTDWHEKKPNGK